MGNTECILVAVADDHTLYRTNLCSYLTRYGLKVVLASPDGDSLIEAIESTDQMPDICILDIHMPGSSGIQTADMIRKQWPSVALLLMSMDLSAGTNLAYPFLEKGGDPAEVCALIYRLAEHKKKGA